MLNFTNVLAIYKFIKKLKLAFVLPVFFTIGQVKCFRKFFLVFVSKVFDFLQSLSIPRKPVGTPYLGTDYAVKSISNR